MNELTLKIDGGVDFTYRIDNITPEKIKEVFDSILNVLDYKNNYIIKIDHGEDSQNLPTRDQIHPEIKECDGEQFP